MHFAVRWDALASGPSSAAGISLGQTLWIPIYPLLPLFLVIRRFHSFVALGPSQIGLCWPKHFLSTLNAVTVYEMRQETCTGVAMGENIASQHCCRITEASLLLPPRTTQRCLYLFPFLLCK